MYFTLSVQVLLERSSDTKKKMPRKKITKEEVKSNENIENLVKVRFLRSASKYAYFVGDIAVLKESQVDELLKAKKIEKIENA